MSYWSLSFQPWSGVIWSLIFEIVVVILETEITLQPVLAWNSLWLSTDLKYLTAHKSLPPYYWDFRWTTSLLDETLTLFIIDFDFEFVWSRRLCLIEYNENSNHISFPNSGVVFDVVMIVLSSIHVSYLSLTSVVYIRLWFECDL